MLNVDGKGDSNATGCIYLWRSSGRPLLPLLAFKCNYIFLFNNKRYGRRHWLKNVECFCFSLSESLRNVHADCFVVFVHVFFFVVLYRVPFISTSVIKGFLKKECVQFFILLIFKWTRSRNPFWFSKINFFYPNSHKKGIRVFPFEIVFGFMNAWTNQIRKYKDKK